MKYEEMTFAQLRNAINQIDNDLRNFPNMSQRDKDNLSYERMQLNGHFQRRMAKMLM